MQRRDGPLTLQRGKQHAARHDGQRHVRHGQHDQLRAEDQHGRQQPHDQQYAGDGPHLPVTAARSRQRNDHRHHQRQDQSQNRSMRRYLGRM